MNEIKTDVKQEGYSEDAGLSGGLSEFDRDLMTDKKSRSYYDAFNIKTERGYRKIPGTAGAVYDAVIDSSLAGFVLNLNTWSKSEFVNIPGKSVEEPIAGQNNNDGGNLT
jgi:hypothetical protein